MNTLQLTDRQMIGLLSMGLVHRDLTVTREAGSRSCVLTGKKDGREIERVTTKDPQMMVDYLDLVYPGEIVRWRLIASKKEEVGRNGCEATAGLSIKKV